MEADYELIDNEERHQYEFHVDKYTPKIEYIKSTNGEIYLTHTEVPTQLGGKGIGSQLVEKALKDIEKTRTKVSTSLPVCSGIHSQTSRMEKNCNERYSHSIINSYEYKERIYERGSDHHLATRPVPTCRHLYQDPSECVSSERKTVDNG